MTRTCDELQADLAENGVAGLREDAVAREHVATCDACYVVVEGLAALEEAIRSVPGENAPQGVVDELLHKVRADSVRAPRAATGWMLPVAAALAVGLGSLLLWSPLQRVPPPADPGAAATREGTARFTLIEGTVKVKPVGAYEWHTATLDHPLRRNDLVRTSAQSTAEITFFDGTVVGVRPESLLTIEETSQDPLTRRMNVRWRVDNGSVQFRVPAAPGTREVTTRRVRATVDPETVGAVAVAETSGATAVRIFEGAGALTSASGETLRLSRGQGVNVDESGRPEPAHTLPAPPELLAPVADVRLVVPDPPRATTRLTWTKVSGATGYRLVLADSPGLSRPLVDRRLEARTSIDLHGLEPGRFHWTVAAVNAIGIEGRAARPEVFSVTSPTAPVALHLNPLQPRGFVVHVSGRTEPGAQVMINGQAVNVSTDGTFSEHVTVASAGTHEIHVRATTGDRSAEIRRNVVVGF